MIKRIFHALKSSSRDLLHNWRALIVMFVLYLAMFGAAYQFLQTREATAGLILLSLLLALAVPVLFLVIQTMAARYNQEQQPLALLGGALRDFWKMLVIAIPLILIAVLASYFFSKTGNAPATAIREVTRALPASPRTLAPKPQPISWQAVAITTLEYLIFFLILPLAAIHLWIATAREGLKRSFGQSARILVRSFSPTAVVTYLIGFIFFAIVPYFLVVTRTPAGSAWLDAGLLVVRLLFAILFSLVGWVVTVGALGELSEAKSAASVAQRNEGTGHVPVEA